MSRWKYLTKRLARQFSVSEARPSGRAARELCQPQRERESMLPSLTVGPLTLQPVADFLAQFLIFDFDILQPQHHVGVQIPAGALARSQLYRAGRSDHRCVVCR